MGDAPMSATASTLVEILRAGRTHGASDAIIRAERGTYYKIDGENVDANGVTAERELLEFVDRWAPARGKAALEARRACGFAAQDETFGRLRVQAARDVTGLSLSVRYIAEQIPSLEYLDPPAAILAAARARQGLLLFSGSVGSGKTTLQASLVANIVLPAGIDGIEVADPIEYRHDASLRFRQYEVGTHFDSFFEGCLHQLRSNASVFVIGEVRDTETARALLLAAEAGALCFATLHTSRTVDVADRLLALFPSSERELARTQLSHTLVGVVGPRLVKKKDGHRRAAYEWLPAVPGVRTAIRQGDTHALEYVMTSPGDTGAISLERHLVTLVKRGEVTRETALASANDRNHFEELVRR